MHDFFWGLTGVDYTAMESGYDFEGDETKPDSFEVTDELSFGNHPMINDFKYLKSLVDELGDGSQIAMYPIPSPTMFIYRQVSNKEKELCLCSRLNETNWYCLQSGNSRFL